MKFVIELEDKPQFIDDIAYYKCKQAPWWSISDNIIDRLSPYIEPERKKGKWFAFCRGKICNCSICHKGYDNKDGFIEEWNYCPNCGAKMERW